MGTIKRSIWKRAARLLTSVAMSFVIVGLPMVSTPSLSFAAPKTAKAQIGKNNINAALKQACLPGGLFDGFLNLFSILDGIDGILAALDNALNGILGGFNTDWYPTKCLPNIGNIINFNPDFLKQCMNLIPIPKCTFPTDFDAEGALKNCLSGIGNINIPNPDLDKIAQCAIPNIPNIDLSQLGGLLQNIIDQLMARLAALDGIFTPKNINLANWFLNLCGNVQKGNVKINVVSTKKK